MDELRGDRLYREERSGRARARRPWLKIVAIGVPVLVAVGMVAYGYWWWQGRADEALTPDTEERQLLGDVDKGPSDVAELITEVNKLVLLPEGETPTVITVTDKDELASGEEFFNDAQDGDKVLVYEQAKKAFLYRPSSGQVINLASINLAEGEEATDEEGPAAGEARSDDRPIRVVLRNGTLKKGLTYDFEPELLAANSDIEIVSRDNATEPDFVRSLMIVFDEDREEIAKKLANDLGLKIDILPGGETVPIGDFLIILGADQLEENKSE